MDKDIENYWIECPLWAGFIFKKGEAVCSTTCIKDKDGKWDKQSAQEDMIDYIKGTYKPNGTPN